MNNTLLISLIALAIDFSVCLFFGAHLYLNKEYRESRLQKLFIYLFFLFALFLLIIPFYIPGLITTDPVILKLSFLTGFGVLFIISVLIFAIILYDQKTKYQETIIPAWSMISVLTWVYLAYKINPSLDSLTRLSLWGVTPYSTSLVAVIVGLPFVVAGITFLSRAVKAKSSRKKFLLLGFGFPLIIIGGPLHQFSWSLLYTLGDMITTTGFVLLFLSLIIEEKN